MTKNKSTKRALLMSALSLLLCVSMLAGSTFAWFTDSVTSSGNKIQAGTLKLDLELLEKNEDGTTKWTSLKDSKAPIFNYDKWEPGYTDVKILKVENEGTLALKWVAKFVSANDLTELADVIDVYVKPSADEFGYATDRADLSTWTKKGTVAEFVNTISETTYGNLEANESAYLGIALKMQESAGNKYQGMDLGGAFDIMILATQYTSESDSFNNQYDVLAGETHYMMNGVNYASFDEAVANATPDKDGVVTYFIGGEAVFSGGWGAPIAPDGTKKVVISGTGADTASLNLANTYRNSLHATGMVVEISNITIECDPCGTHQDQRNIWVCADELYATNVVFKDPADASNVKKAVFDGCTFASATADEEPSGGNYQLWVGDHDANYGSVTESVVVKNSVFKSGKRAIKLAPTTGSTSYTAVIDNNVFYNIAYKPAVCLNYGAQVNTVTITNNTLYNTALVEDEVNGNYTESNNTLIATPEMVQYAIDNARDGETVKLSAGKYGTIVAKSNITIEGVPGAVVDCINLNGAKNTTLKGITFDAAGAQEAYDYTGTRRSYANIISGFKDTAIGARNIVIDGCTFTGKFENAGAAIAFADRSRPTGGSGNVTVKNCTFNTENANYDVYGYYTGSPNMTFTFENNVFADDCHSGPIYLAKLKTSEAIVVNGNTFKTKATLSASVYVKGDTGYNPTVDAADNTFAE